MRTKINGQTDLLMDTDEKLQVYFQAQQAGAAVPSAAFEEIKELLSVQSRGHAAIRRLTHMFLYEYYHEVHKTAVQDIEAKSGQRQSSRFSPCRELIRDEAWS